MPGFSIYRNDRNSKGGGVALLINNNILHNEVILPQIPNTQAVGVEINCNNIMLLLVQIYITQNKLSPSDLNKIFQLRNKVIIMGDFNARLPEWNCFSSNSNGTSLINFCLNKHIKIAAPDLPRHHPKIDRPSIIDFFLIKNYDNYTRPVTECILSSDHNPVLLNLNDNVDQRIRNRIHDYKNVLWHKFRKYIDENINLSFHISTKEQVGQKVTELILLN